MFYYNFMSLAGLIIRTKMIIENVSFNSCGQFTKIYDHLYGDLSMRKWMNLLFTRNWRVYLQLCTYWCARGSRDCIGLFKVVNWSMSIIFNRIHFLFNDIVYFLLSLILAVFVTKDIFVDHNCQHWQWWPFVVILFQF